MRGSGISDRLHMSDEELGQAGELSEGAQILKALKAKTHMMVGEHDWYLDMGAKWTKLGANTMTMGPHGLLGLRNGEAVAMPGMADIAMGIGRESLAVGTALGYRIEPIFGLRADEFAGSSDENLATTRDALMRHVGSRSRTAPIHDHIKGRKSEMEFITGIVSRKGRELGIPTPFNDAVLEIDRQINKGEIKMDRSNLGLLKTRIAASSK